MLSRYLEIERENKILLEKITKIMCKPKYTSYLESLPSQISTNTDNSSYKSLNKIMRK